MADIEAQVVLSPETTLGPCAAAALEMLSAFCAVGATSFDVTIKKLQAIEGQFRRGQEALPLSSGSPFAAVAVNCALLRT